MWDSTRGRASITLVAGQRKQLITFDVNDLTPRISELYEEGRLVIRVSLANYSAKEPKLAQKIKIELPQQEITVNSRLVDYTLNPNLSEAAFSVEAPPGLSPMSF